jgi:outer membrane biosynthesis protein TonB
MAKFERGVYEPSDEVRVFDGSEDDDDVEGSRLPLLIVLALLVLAMFGGVVWLAYTQGVARGRGETPVLTAAAGPEKIAPSQPGGSNVPYQGFKIYEQPAPSDDSADTAPPPPAKPEAAKIDTAPAATAPPLKQQTAPVDAKPAPVAAPAKVEPQKVVAPKPTPAPVKTAAAPPPKSVAALIQQANTTPPPAKVAAAPVPATSASGAPATGAPRQLGAPVAAATKPAPVAAKPAAAGAYVLQIGAYKSQADADAAWKAYKAKHAALLSGYAPDVQQAQLGEKGTWYRLRIAGFSDKDGASATCDRLKADGGNCFLGK